MDKSADYSQLKPPEKLNCQECHTGNPESFDKIYYIPKGGNLPEGWVIMCKRCIGIVEGMLLNYGK